MQKLIDVSAITDFYNKALVWLMTRVLVLSTLVQAIVLLIALAIALLCARPLRAWLDGALERHAEHGFRIKVLGAVRLVVVPLLWPGCVWIGVFIARGADWPLHLLKSAGSLLTAWLLIRLTSQFVRDRIWAQFAAVTLWTVAALNILGLLDPTLDLMDSLAITIGQLRLSLLSVVKGVLSLCVLVWAATAISGVLERRFRRSPNLTPSVLVLLAKLTRATLLIMAILIAINSIGINLTAFTVFSGALGVGIGFGLQKIIANLVSGVILLLEKSIKPGDVIAVNGTYGWVESFGARFVWDKLHQHGIEIPFPQRDLHVRSVFGHQDDDGIDLVDRRLTSAAGESGA